MKNLIESTTLERNWIESTLFSQCDFFRLKKGTGEELQGKSLYCLFYDPSFITRASFQRAMHLLGGQFYQTENASQSFPVTETNHIDNVVAILHSLRMDAVVIRSNEPNVMSEAASADLIPVVSGGGIFDHPTQALADLYTLHLERGSIDGSHVAIVGRVEHRNINAWILGLSLFKDITISVFSLSGAINPKILSLCVERGIKFREVNSMDEIKSADVVYLNAPRTEAHANLLKSRGIPTININQNFMDSLHKRAIVMNPIQRSGDFSIDVVDNRLAFYRQSENALIIRMAVLVDILS
jgi:aspartate carbamoyltransferase catalytic subunit